MSNEDGGLAALIGLILVHNDGEYRIPKSLVEAGLPEGKRFSVGPSDDDTELVMKLVDI